VTDSPLDLDATAQRRLVESGDATPGELVEQALARIAERSALGAVAAVLADVALGRCADPALHALPLGGVPFLLKDAGATLVGLPQWLGSGLLRALDHRAATDTVLGRRFLEAGLIPVGTSTMPEFGLQPTTQPLAFGPARNPAAGERSAGGSSGGAAAAVAAGIVPVAHASDIGGSIRIPAAWCGLVGLKPSRGRTSTAPLVDPNLVEHVLTRSVRDTALVLDLVAGPSPGDTYALPDDGGYGRAAAADPQRLRIGVVTNVEASDVDVDPDCERAALDVARRLEALGHHVEEASPRRLHDDAFAFHTFVTSSFETARMLDGIADLVGRPLVAADVEPYTWALAAAGRDHGDAAFAASQVWERAYTASVGAWWAEGFDVLLSPATGEPAPLLAELAPPPADPLAIVARFRRCWCFCTPFNVTGQPAIVVPAGRTRSGLPLAVQLVAPLGREDVLLAAAGQLERSSAPAGSAT
jgi:amidase